ANNNLLNNLIVISFNTVTPNPGQTTSQKFVFALYQQLLLRPPDGTMMNDLGNLLDSGQVTQHQVTMGILNSPEYLTNLTNKLYHQFLGRDGDPGSLQNVLAYLQNGGSIDIIRSIIVGSQEYFQNHGGTNDGFITGVYQDVLGRAVDPVGQAATQA